MSKSKKVTIGYRYYFDLLMGLGRGEYDEIVAIKVGDKMAWEGSVTGNATITINQPDLFGGDKGEGGIQGTLDIFMGGPAQTISAKVAAALGGLVPAFRGVVTLFYSGLVTSLNPYPKPWKFRRRRALKGWDGEPWYPEKAVITLTDPETGGTIKAMNPAHILYELETNRDWGRGKARARLDDAVWRAAADQLYADGFGLCLRWIRTDSIANFAGSVISHMGANLYTSRVTGLRKLTLIRDDYDPATLPHFTPDSGLLSIAEDDNSGGSDSINEIVVTWRNPIDNSDRRVRERNPAAVRSTNGRHIPAEASYPGIPTAELAGRLAKRDLRLKGYAKRWKLILDRRARDIEPGQPFKFSDPKRGLSNIVVRAARIDDGNSSRRSEIAITAVLDVFGLPATTFSAPVPSGWVPPNRTPQAIVTRRVFEASWRDLTLEIDDANRDLISSTASILRSLAVRPTTLALNFDVQSRVGAAAFETRATGDFSPTAQLAAGMAAEYGPTTISLANGIDLENVVAGTAVLIDDEVGRLVSINLTAMAASIGRGCVDTVPAAHAAGTRIWFIDDAGGLDPTQYTATTTVQTKLLTRTSSGVLDTSLAGTDSITAAARQARPYPPGNAKINGTAYPSTVSGSMTVTWAHRDRLLQADQLVDTTQGSIGPEPGVRYGLRFLDSLGATIIQKLDVAGATAAVILNYTGAVTVQLFAISDNGQSVQMHQRTFTYTPPGGTTASSIASATYTPTVTVIDGGEVAP